MFMGGSCARKEDGVGIGRGRRGGGAVVVDRAKLGLWPPRGFAGGLWRGEEWLAVAKTPVENRETAIFHRIETRRGDAADIMWFPYATADTEPLEGQADRRGRH